MGSQTNTGGNGNNYPLGAVAKQASGMGKHPSSGTHGSTLDTSNRSGTNGTQVKTEPPESRFFSTIPKILFCGIIDNFLTSISGENITYEASRRLHQLLQPEKLFSDWENIQNNAFTAFCPPTPNKGGYMYMQSEQAETPSSNGGDRRSPRKSNTKMRGSGINHPQQGEIQNLPGAVTRNYDDDGENWGNFPQAVTRNSKQRIAEDSRRPGVTGYEDSRVRTTQQVQGTSQFGGDRGSTLIPTMTKNGGVPTFTGDKKSPVTFEAYEMSIHYHSDIYNLNDLDTARLIVSSIDGEAHVTTMHYISSQRRSLKPHPTTEQLLSMLRRTFGNTRSDNEILQELINFTRKNDEGLLAYTKRYENVVSR